MQFGSWFEGLDRDQTKAVDEHTVRVVFKEPRVTQLQSFNISVIPEHVYGPGDFKKNTKVIGSGPYVLVRRETGRSIVLQRRPDYWRTKPHIETLKLRVIADDTVAWNALKRGDADVARITNDTWAGGKDDPAVKEKIQFHSLYLLGYNCIVWNLDDPLLNDVRVRRALAMSFDLPTVIDRLYHGQARTITGPFTPDQWANDPRVQPIAFNLQGAAALLSAAGWTDSNGDGVLDREGKKFSFKALIPAGNAPANNESQVLQDALKQIGVVMEITPLDDAAYFEQILARNFQAVFMGWASEPDPDPYGLFHSSQIPPAGLNVAGYKNPEADQLMEEGRREFDRARRAEIYHRLHEILARDQPYLWTVQPATKWGVNRRIQNVESSTGGLGLFLWSPGPHGWWLRKPG
jgi:peptide/nickel transport system substrate-binding protein